MYSPSTKKRMPYTLGSDGTGVESDRCDGNFFDGIIVRAIGCMRLIATSEIGVYDGRGNSIGRGQLFIVAGRGQGGIWWAGVARRLHQAGRSRKWCDCCFPKATRSTGHRVYRAAGLVGCRIFYIRYKQIPTGQNIAATED